MSGSAPLKPAESQGNPAQHEAIIHERGPCLVLAGPGSGKTFVLVRHLHHMIRELGIPQRKIMVLTFSRAAAAQMKERFTRQEGEESRVTFGTFHACFFRLLLKAGPLQLLSEADSDELLGRLLKRYCPDVEQDEEVLRSVKLSMSLRRAGCEPESLPEEDWGEKLPRIIASYEAYLRENALTDFDGILRLFRERLEEPAFLRSVRARYSHLLVDEFQDINPVQYDVLRRIAGERGEIFAVGDDDQSIYAFRGSSPAIVRRFEADYPQMHRVVLRVNYRCSYPIVRASTLVIRENRDRFEKRVQARDRSGEKVVLIGVPDEEAQEREAGRILERIGEGGSCAVLFRTNSQLERFRRAIAREERTEDASVSLRRVLEDVTDYFVLGCGMARGTVPAKPFSRILNRPDRLLSGCLLPGETLARQDLRRWARERSAEDGAVLSDLLDDLSLIGRVKPALGLSYLSRTVGYGAFARKGLRGEALQRMEALWSEMEDAAKASEDAAAFAERLREMQKAFAEREARGQRRRQEEGAGERTPRLMTMHASKGLEFDTVILPYLNEGRIPVHGADTPEAIEEERRLFYVAMTRAKSRLVLLFTASETVEKSRFLDPLIRFGAPNGEGGAQGPVICPPCVRFVRSSDELEI